MTVIMICLAFPLCVICSIRNLGMSSKVIIIIYKFYILFILDVEFAGSSPTNCSFRPPVVVFWLGECGIDVLARSYLRFSLQYNVWHGCVSL